MASFKERTPYEQETLIFSAAEKAKEFRETVNERLPTKQVGIRRDREIIAEVVADEFAAEGHSVSSLRRPWEHTAEEHVEVQKLIDLAFSQNIGKALAAARGSGHYPRNVDLLHDLLTSELHDAIVSEKLNRQPLAGWLLLVVAVIVLAVIMILLVSAGALFI